jgi:hypothetical protein
MEHFPRFGHQERIFWNLLDDGWRMRVHNHLSQWIIRAYFFVDIRGDVLQKPNHRRDSCRVNAVFGFLETEDTLDLGILLQHSQGKET